jgi:hypothetical protein
LGYDLTLFVIALVWFLFCFDCIYIAFICCLLCLWRFSREPVIKSLQLFIMIWCWHCVCMRARARVCVCVS